MDAGDQTLLLDLGGVLVGAEHERAVAALSALAGRGAAQIRAALYESGLVARLEIGAIDAAAFRDRVRAALGVALADEALDDAWCRALFPLAGIDALLVRAAADRRLFLLSNTNPIHFDRVRREVGWLGLFSGLHLSHEIGLAKPDPAFFAAALDRFGLAARGCLFLDDRPENVRAAAAAGIAARRVDPPGLALAHLSPPAAPGPPRAPEEAR